MKAINQQLEALYVSYHPRALEQNPKAKDFVLNAIAAQRTEVAAKI